MPTELVPGVHRLDLGYVNAYLVEDGDDVVLCDAGMPWSADAIRDRLAAVCYEPADVDRVLLTHFDLDHVGALSKLDLHAPAYAGEPDGSFLRGDAKPPLSNHKGWLQRAMGRYVDRPGIPIRRIADGDPIGSFTAYHTPGHTPGHVVYVSEELDVALLGDLVTASGGELEPPPWHLNYDTDEVRESVRALARRAPPFEAACVGHGTPLQSGGSAALPTEPPAEDESGGLTERLKAGAGRVRGAARRGRAAAGRVRGAAGRVRRVAGRVR